MEKSFWSEDCKREYPSLEKDEEGDVAVIGGGLSGVMCAYELSARGYRVLLLEADRIARGESGKSSAMLSFAHDLIYDPLIKKHGIEAAKEYWTRNKEGLSQIVSIIKREKIDCDYHPCDMVLFATTRRGKKKLYMEQRAYAMLGQQSLLTDSGDGVELPFSVLATLRVRDQGRINPYRFVRGLAEICAGRGVRIFEGTRVVGQPEDGRLSVGDYVVKANKFVIATHFPFLNVPGFYFAKMYQSRSHNIVFKTQTRITHLYESAEDDGFEYRAVEGGVLCGGAQVRTGKYKYRSRYRQVEQEIKTRFSDAQEISRFSAQDCMTFDMLPFVGTYSDLLKNVLVVTGFNKWGFTTSAAAAKMIAELVSGQPTNSLFAPERSYFTAAPVEAVRNIGALLLSFADLLVCSDAKKMKRIKNGQGSIVRIGWKRVGVYRDYDGSYKAIAAVCPHLGCSLKWNKDECTWDCPCHGSRFTPDGDILSSPATECAHRIEVKP